MKKTKTKDFDEAFDKGEDVSSYLDISKARRINTEVRRVNVDFPIWVIESLDREARRLGISRQALLKMWVAERIDASFSNETVS